LIFRTKNLLNEVERRKGRKVGEEKAQRKIDLSPLLLCHNLLLLRTSWMFKELS
jgi:hypothetical protein